MRKNNKTSQIQALAKDIQIIEQFFPFQIGAENKTEITNIFEIFSQKSIFLNQEINIIQHYLQQKYPKNSLQKIVSQLYSLYHEKIVTFKNQESYKIIWNWYLNNKINFNSDNIQDGIFFSQQDSNSFKDQIINCQISFDQNNQKDYKSNNQNHKIQIQNSENNDFKDFYDSNQEQQIYYKFFEGPSVQKAIKNIRSNLNYINQKKVVHVFTKKGYGLDKYENYLSKRKLDTKEWQFYQNQLKINDNYNKYLNIAIYNTSTVIFQFLNQMKNNKNTLNQFKNIFQFKQHEKLGIMIQNLSNPLFQIFSECMKFVYDLKIQQQIQSQKINILLNGMTQMKKIKPH